MESRLKFFPTPTWEINTRSIAAVLSQSVVAIHRATTPLSYTQLKDIPRTGSGPVNILTDPSLAEYL
jgi:hypothetical protein